MVEDIVRWLDSPFVQLAIAVSGVIGVIVVGLRLVNAIREYRARSQSQRLSLALAQSSGVQSLTAEDIAAAVRFYVEPYCTQTDPSDEKDLRNVVALAPLFKTVDAYFRAGGEKRHLIVLADSGMGKTSFCINYFVREVKNRTDAPNVVIVPLGRGDAIDQISSISNKREKLAFLDAFDEDPGAIGNKAKRLADLMSAASDFKNIVVTCRTQFFEDDDSIPKGSGVMYAGPRRAGVPGELPLYKIFLAPFSKDQIEVFIVRNFPLLSFTNSALRRKARELVESIPELSVRPMLLELLPDLVRERRKITELYELYSFLVEKWVLREKGWIEPEQLRGISAELAVVLLARQQAGGGDRLSPSELSRIAAEHESPLEDWQIKSRSLLNRDIGGQYKFAHRSILEYFIVQGVIAGDRRCYSLLWTDLIKDLLVSWGQISDSNSSRLMEMLESDPVVRERLYSLASPLPLPSLRSAANVRDIVKSRNISRRHSRTIPVSWRNCQYRVEANGGSLQSLAFVVDDGTHGIRWYVNDTSTIDDVTDRGIFREGYSAILRLGGKRRLPSLEEVISLWESESHLVRNSPIRQIFDRREVYWLGDSTEAGMLCCSFGDQSLDGAPLRLVGSRVSDSGDKLHVYELIAKHGAVAKVSYRAMPILIDSAD
ncbi:MAG: hypothetical protein U1D69_04795 [Polynucleobacter sp.]|nr:hypothetical protein [Polynucleobacter sp.]